LHVRQLSIMSSPYGDLIRGYERHRTPVLIAERNEISLRGKLIAGAVVSRIA